MMLRDAGFIAHHRGDVKLKKRQVGELKYLSEWRRNTTGAGRTMWMAPVTNVVASDASLSVVNGTEEAGWAQVLGPEVPAEMDAPAQLRMLQAEGV